MKSLKKHVFDLLGLRWTTWLYLAVKDVIYTITAIPGLVGRWSLHSPLTEQFGSEFGSYDSPVPSHPEEYLEVIEKNTGRPAGRPVSVLAYFRCVQQLL